MLATDYSDRMAVGACGPGGLISSLSEAVGHATELGKIMRGEIRRNIRLHCEEYGW